MAKDFFQDIVPPDADNRPSIPTSKSEVRKLRPISTPEFHHEESNELDLHAQDEEYTDDDIQDVENAASAPRGIRNISMPPRSRPGVNDLRDRGVQYIPRPGRKISRLWIWIAIGLCVVVLGFFALFLFKQTSVTVIPRTQTVTFDETTQLTAYPANNAATGTLSYVVVSTDITDSQDVTGTGTTAVQAKASGTITVYNNYSTASVKLIKNTRFQSPSGLIFRTPADVVIPGKKGANPGHIDITVAADQTGQQYNIAAGRFTVPGLKTTPAMYSAIYAQSSAAMAGGFAGNQAGVAVGDRQKAVTDIRARLAQKVTQFIQTKNTGNSIAFADIAEVTYTDAADVDAGTGHVQINEAVHVDLPVFTADSFTSILAQTMTVATDEAPVTLQGGAGYHAVPKDITPVKLGTDSLDFALVGKATFVWTVDGTALATALASRDQAVFETIVGGFPGIKEAHARIEPFWKTSFPSDPTKIKVQIQNPLAASSSSSN
jgi:hypothetical protein